MQEYTPTPDFYNDYICHYGVPGMKWGVRKYYGKNGKLNKRGKRHLQNIRWSAKENETYSIDHINRRRAGYINTIKDPKKKKQAQDWDKAYKEADKKFRKINDDYYKAREKALKNPEYFNSKEYKNIEKLYKHQSKYRSLMGHNLNNPELVRNRYAQDIYKSGHEGSRYSGKKDYSYKYEGMTTKEYFDPHDPTDKYLAYKKKKNRS